MASWTGPDRTLGDLCTCGHNRAQHNFGHDACNAMARCECTKFVITAR